MTRDRLLAHMTVRQGAGVERPLPDLALPFLKCVGERGAELPWHVRNTDLVMHRPHTIAEFNEAAQGPMDYDSLVELLGRVSVLDEITIFVPRHDLTDIELNEQLLRRDFSALRICIDLFDSSEWTFFSDSPAELARAAAVVQAQNDSSGDVKTAGSAP